MIPNALKLVVVDDEIPQLNALTSILADQGFDVQGFGSPLNTLAHLAHEPADLVLSDLKLPDMSGIEFIERAQALDQDMGFILMTGHGSLESAVDALRLGVHDYVMKPFRINQILAVIEHVRNQRQLKMDNKALLAELATSNGRLRELNSELDTFAGRVAHDLNSIVHLIQGYSSSLLGGEDALSSKQRTYLQRINQTSERGGKLVADLLAFARLGSGSLSYGEVQLQALVAKAKVIAELESDGPKADWVVDALPMVRADEALVEQVFLNLFSNALKYSRHQDRPLIHVKCVATEAHHCIEVQDNGAGFDPALAGDLFKPFQRLHNAHEFEGHGMGLANVKRIVERHQWQISARAKPGEGATFSLLIPKQLSRAAPKQTPALAQLHKQSEAGSLPVAVAKPQAVNLADAALLRFGGHLGRLGGWALEFTPEPVVHWSDEIYSLLDAPGDRNTPLTLQQCFDLYIDDDKQRMEQAIEACARHGTPFDLDVQMFTFSRRRFWARVAGEAIVDEHGQVVVIQGCFQDISKHRDALHTVHRINSLLQAQNEVNVEIPRISSIDQMFEEVCKRAPTIGKIPLVWICRYESDTEDLRVVAKGGVHLELVDHVMNNMQVKRSHPIYLHLSKRQVYVAQDVRVDPFAAPWRDKAIELGLESFAIIPLMLKDELVASMVYFGYGTDFFDPGMVDLLNTISKNRSLALENVVNNVERAETLSRLQVLETCVESLNEMVMIIEAEAPNGRSRKILYVNEAYCRTTGFSKDEIIGQTPQILHGPLTNKEGVDRILRAMKDWRPVKEELIKYKKNGDPFWVELEIIPVANASGWYTHWVAIQRDITSRIEEEREKESNLERFRSLANATSDCIWDWDLQKNDHVWWSEGIQTLFGYSPEQIEPTVESWTSRIHPDELERVSRGVHAVIEHDALNSWRDEYRFARADGTWADVVDRGFVIRDSSGKAVRMIGGMTDISHIKRVQRDSETQLLKMNLLSEITQAVGHRLDIDSIYTVVANALEKDLPSDFCFMGSYDPLSRKVSVRALSNQSQVIAKKLGIRELDTIDIDGTHLGEACSGVFVNEGNLESSYCPIARRLQEEFKLNSMVIIPLFKEARVLGVMVSARVSHGEYSPGEISFLKQLGEHVSLALSQAELLRELQDAYTKLSQTQELVLQQERLRALAEMAGGIAHDINNAISPAALYIESMLMSCSALNDKERKQLETVQMAIDDVASTVQRMSRFAKGSNDSVTGMPTDPNRLYSEALELTRARWESIARERGVSIDIQDHFEENLPAIQGSGSELREALTNLILNGVDAMPQGGILRINGRLETDQMGAFVVLEVEDSGVGMTEEVRARCMEPFFTTKGERGTGFGLSMVYGITKRLGGSMTIESHFGQGTRVCLRLPVVCEGAPNSAPREDSQPDSNPGRVCRILLVDDDDAVREALSTVLAQAGHHVTEFNNASSAFAAFEESQSSDTNRFDLLLTDLGMHETNGRELSKMVRELVPGFPILVISGWGTQLNLEQEFIDWADAIITKPPKKDELLKAIDALV